MLHSKTLNVAYLYIFFNLKVNRALYLTIKVSQDLH